MDRSNANVLAALLGKPKLSGVMSALFVALSVPILIFILLFSYYENSAEIASILDREIAKTQQLTVDDAEDFINPIANTLRLIAGMAAADPALFRTEESRELLYRAVTSSEQIDAVYASFEDGYHRVVTRIDDDRRRSDPQIPAAANCHWVSLNSITVIADLTDGPIIAYPEKQKEVRTVHDHLIVATLSTILDTTVRAAYRQYLQTKTDSFIFKSPEGDQEYSASFTSFPESFSLPWQVIILTPTKDFVGA